MRSGLSLLLALAVFGAASRVQGAEPFLKPKDVIALVGGEDMVAMSEYGYLELLLTRALPDYQLRFRNLAWEGDTVFEQPRELNFPTLEQQLDKVGATIVIAQFGQMESLAGIEKLPEFIAAYAGLIERMNKGGQRRIVLVAPGDFPPAQIAPIPMPGLPFAPVAIPSLKGEVLMAYSTAIQSLARRSQAQFTDVRDEANSRITIATRDGVHLTEEGHSFAAIHVGEHLAPVEVQRAKEKIWTDLPASQSGITRTTAHQDGERLARAVEAKNRLWFHYWRPQNWAFLAGDRTTQPSSRDHVDPSKRWFPAEIEEFVPLIEAKEREIDVLAAKLATP